MGEWFQANFKLARQFGVMNLVVQHTLADLQAVGVSGSRAATIAEGLVADASTRIIFYQQESQVELTRTLLGLSDSEARLIGILSPSQALWRVASRGIRDPALPLRARDAPDQHRHRDARQQREGGASVRPPSPPRPSSNPPRAGALELLTALSYELLDAHRDTMELATGLPDGEWRAHVEYLRALQRTGHELLAQAWSAEVPR